MSTKTQDITSLIDALQDLQDDLEQDIKDAALEVASEWIQEASEEHKQEFDDNFSGYDYERDDAWNAALKEFGERTADIMQNAFDSWEQTDEAEELTRRVRVVADAISLLETLI